MGLPVPPPRVPRLQVPARLFALVPRDDPLDEAECSGGTMLFSDSSRWRTPGAAPVVQYLCGDEDVARARVTSWLTASGLTASDLRPSRGPHLVDVAPGSTDAADLTSATALVGCGLPADYPTGANRGGVPAKCRGTGDALIASGEALLAVRPTEAAVRMRVEVIAVPSRVALPVVKRRPFKAWF